MSGRRTVRASDVRQARYTFVMELGTMNGVRVASAARVPWKLDDDAHVRARCEGRGLVLFDGGGKADAIVVGGRAIVWERQGERFRAFALAPLSVRALLLGAADFVGGVARDIGDRDRTAMAALFHIVGTINALAAGAS